MKDNFLLKTKLGEQVETLTNEEAGQLFKGIFKYVNTGDSGLTGLMYSLFIPIKEDIDKNEESYKKKCETNRVNGLLGGAPKGNQNARKKSTDDDGLLSEIDKTTENNQMVVKNKKNNRKQHDVYHISYITNHNSYIINQIINYLNTKLDSNYKTNSKNTIKHINARLNEGYVFEDFVKVINKKYNEWYGTDMQQYLRPETLFGNKFEGYLNQPSKKITIKNLNVDLSDFMEEK